MPVSYQPVTQPVNRYRVSYMGVMGGPDLRGEGRNIQG